MFEFLFLITRINFKENAILLYFSVEDNLEIVCKTSKS